jgi:demethylmenaquinone methyltransferase / 2-methoxy-6-polyprenyl-1,4-benzoquinol methylase
MPENKNKKTHFGYEDVNWDDKQQKVAEVFHSVAPKYDLMNDLMSAGVHRFWKKVTIQRANAKKGDNVLDIAGGTGDLAYKFSKAVGENGHVILSDINESMLTVGKNKLIDKGCIENLSFIQANAEKLPFIKNTFDVITISFGLRNVTNKDEALRSMYRVIKPGGKVLILEFSKPLIPILSKIYDKYSFTVLPFLGKLLLNDSKSYKYLAESIRKHPDQETLKAMMEESGFSNCSYHNMSGGIVSLHIGYKY